MREIRSGRVICFAMEKYKMEGRQRGITVVIDTTHRLHCYHLPDSTLIKLDYQNGVGFVGFPIAELLPETQHHRAKCLRRRPLSRSSRLPQRLTTNPSMPPTRPTTPAASHLVLLPLASAHLRLRLVRTQHRAPLASTKRGRRSRSTTMA